MAKLTRESLIKRVFNDPKNYPYGFGRSGDFSITESKALMQFGSLYAALVDGLFAPETDEDKRMLNVALGGEEPVNVADKAWLKYQKRINRPKYGSIYGSKASVNDEEMDTVSEDSDLEIEMDD